MASLTATVQTFSISVSLLASGGIAALSLFDVPLLQSQPASRSLPLVRWLFSRGSHIFPTAASISSAGFAYLAIRALPAGSSAITVLRIASNSTKVNGYIAAAALNIAIAPWTALVMIPTNFALIEKNEKKGGARSQQSAKGRQGKDQGSGRSAEDSVDGKGQASQFADLSLPQSHTEEPTTEKEDQETRELLGRFALLNFVRAVSTGLGGIVGLMAALA